MCVGGGGYLGHELRLDGRRKSGFLMSPKPESINQGNGSWILMSPDTTHSSTSWRLLGYKAWIQGLGLDWLCGSVI